MAELAFAGRASRRTLARVALPVVLLCALWSLAMLAREQTVLPRPFWGAMAALHIYLVGSFGLVLRNFRRPVVEIGERSVIFGALAAPHRRRIALADVVAVGDPTWIVSPAWTWLRLSLRSGAAVRIWVGDLSPSDRRAVREAIASRVRAL